MFPPISLRTLGGMADMGVLGGVEVVFVFMLVSVFMVIMMIVLNEVKDE